MQIVDYNSLNTSISLFNNLKLNDDVDISLTNKSELSLNCSVCRRFNRVIIFKENDFGVCTPTMHKFPGKITTFQSQDSENQESRQAYILECDFYPFVDQKYGYYVDSCLNKNSTIQVNFVCPKCSLNTSEELEINSTKLIEKFCQCGYLLYTLETNFN